MERQLRICHEKCVQDCKFSSQFLDDLIRQGHSLDANSESELMNVLQKRCQLLLLLHHEYRQLCEDKTLQGILQIVEKNIQIAVAFFLAYIDTKDVELQTELLEGNNSQQIYSSTKYQVRFFFSFSLYSLKNQVQQTGFLVYFELDFSCLCSLQKSSSKLVFAG